jgi:hypothetical protein
VVIGVSEDLIEARSSSQHDDDRTVFAKKKKKLGLKLEGEIEGNYIKGQAWYDEGA